MIARYVFLSATLFTTTASAGDSTLDAAIGGGLGGAAGAAIGNEIGGRDGAVMGGALGAAVGTAVTMEPERRYIPPPRQPDYRYDPHPGHRPASQFCPPGQAKKGRC